MRQHLMQSDEFEPLWTARAEKFAKLGRQLSKVGQPETLHENQVRSNRLKDYMNTSFQYFVPGVQENHDLSNIKLTLGAPKEYQANRMPMHSGIPVRRTPGGFHQGMQKADMQYSQSTSPSDEEPCRVLPLRAQQTLHRISESLASHKFFFVKAPGCAEQPSRSAENLPGSQVEFSRIEFPKLTTPELRALCSLGKQQSMEFQEFVSSCPHETLVGITKAIAQDIVYMIKNQFSNYIIQRLIKRDVQFLSLVEQYCKLHFFEWCTDEYASRVMQSVIESSRSFRQFALAQFKSDLNPCMESISAVFLLSMAMACSEHHEEYSFVRKIIIQDPKSVIESKYFKRVFVSFIEKAPLWEVDLIFSQLEIDKRFFEYLGDKYKTYILVALIQRGHQSALCLLEQAIGSGLLKLLQTKFFKFLILSLLQSPVHEAMKRISGSLARIDRNQTRQLRQKHYDCFLFYSFITISTANTCKSPLLSELLDRLQPGF